MHNIYILIKHVFFVSVPRSDIPHGGTFQLEGQEKKDLGKIHLLYIF